MIKGLQLNYATQFIYIFALSFTKVSIGLFLVRLAPSGVYKIIVYCILVLVSFYTIAGSIALLATCRPFAANFDRTIPGTSCYSPQTSFALAFTNSCKKFPSIVIPCDATRISQHYYMAIPFNAPIVWHILQFG
jgi:hypothetical protein